MSDPVSRPLADQAARDRFRDDWGRNFAVSANAGSGKTTAISERLAAMALSPGGAALLRRTAVVTFTKKAASQIGQRARAVLLRKVMAAGGRDLAALDQLERAFFGTIHSFCLKLAQTYGQTLGINLNPAVVPEDDEALWEEFLEQDEMVFSVLAESELRAFLRHVPLEEIFPLARQLDAAAAETLRARRPSGPPAAPSEAILAQLLELSGKGKGAANVELSKRRARAWAEDFARGAGFLPLYEPAGTAKATVELAEAWMAPLKRWLAAAAAALAGELAERHRAWRFERGVQTYADQIDAAMAVLRDPATLDRIRAEGWRVILDEAQDTDPQQFAVLVEVARAPGEPRGAWPSGGGAGPRPGHFCMVGDGQQAIYGSRADIGNFRRHLEAFARGDGGERLEFHVTFRAPHAVIGLLNDTLPAAFGEGRDHNLGLPPGPGAPAPYLQVNYSALAPGPGNAPGRVARLPLAPPAPAPKESGVKGWMAEEARQVARFLAERGPAGVGAANWGEICVLAPRNEWLLVVRKEFEAARLKCALQMRKNRNGDQPAYAWMAGLLAVCCDPENTFEWAGVLREVFAVSDGLMAQELRSRGGFKWEQPEVHPAPLRAALEAVRPWILQVNDEGVALGDFARGLAEAAGLAAKARRLDEGGAAAGELERLLAEAAELGLTGAGPRAWLGELLARLEDGRPAGKPADDAINLLTSHSAKGLEWPVVIPVGLWRGIGKASDKGLRLLRDAQEGPRVFFDGASVPQETKDARERERWRELARLLYVTLTRPRRALVLPWAEGWGGRQREQPSFADLWGDWTGAAPEIDESWRELAPAPRKTSKAEPRDAVGVGGGAGPCPAPVPSRPAPALPARLLPHQLAHAPDLARAARHESSLDEPVPVRAGAEEAIDYGLWWHETLEFFPWGAASGVLEIYAARRLCAAEGLGFGERARVEWDAWLASETRAELEAARWVRQAELAVFAPLRADAWMDGVMDLVLHDAAANEAWVVDWKTNRRRAGEADAALLERLRAEYAPQLAAYAASLRDAFPRARIRAWVYATAAALRVEIVSADT